MRKWIVLALFLAGCGRNTGTETAFIPSEGELIAMSGETVPVKTLLPRLTEKDRKRLYRDYPKTLERIKRKERLTVQDIKNLTRAGVEDKVIIHEIHETRSMFYLTPDDEYELLQAGVSTNVINEMNETAGSGY